MYDPNGKAVWKFHLTNGDIVYRNSHLSAIKWFTNTVMLREFDIFSRAKPWEFVASRRLSDYCQCGRPYTESIEGKEFKWVRQHQFEMDTIQLKKFFSSPTLCQRCFYYEEYKNGLWVPKFYKQIFDE